MIFVPIFILFIMWCAYSGYKFRWPIIPVNMVIGYILGDMAGRFLK